MAKTDTLYINKAALDFHARFRTGKIYIKLHPDDKTIAMPQFDALKEIVYKNEEVNIATLYHLEKCLDVSIVKTYEGLEWEGLRPANSRQIYEAGHIVVNMAANNNPQMLARWEKLQQNQYKNFNPNQDPLMAYYIRNMAEFGKLSAYVERRKDFLPEVFKENTSLSVPQIEPIIIQQMNKLGM